MKIPVFPRRIFEATRQLVDENFTFIIFMVCCNLPVLTTYDNVGTVVTQFVYIFVVNVLVALLLCAIPRGKARKTAQAVVIAVSLLLFFLYTYFEIFYHGVPDQSVLEIILETTPSEASGYVMAYLMSAWYVVAFVSVLAVAYLILRHAGKLRSKRGVVSAVSAMVLAGAFMALGNIVVEKLNRDMSTYRRVRYEGCSVIGMTLLMVKAVSNMHAMSKMEGGLRHKPVILRNDSSIPYVVYILGESVTRHHLGLYGYHLNTTPFLSARERQGNFIKFTDVISPDPVTRKSLGKMFTFHRRGMKGEWYESTDLFSILRQAGYHTAWLSNQEYSGKHVNTARLYASRCDTCAYTLYRIMGNHTIADPYDEALFPLLDNVLARPRRKNFIVLHMMGAHQLYSARYPQSRRKFTAAQEYGATARIRAEKADYDNAVLYNDSVIDAVIRRFEDKDAIVVYTPDHGEDVMEENVRMPGHYEMNPNRQMVEIPMIVWVSDKFREKRPGLVERIRRSAARPFVTDDMIHTLLDLMQISTKEYCGRFSVINDRYDSGRIRYCGDRRYRRN